MNGFVRCSGALQRPALACVVALAAALYGATALAAPRPPKTSSLSWARTAGAESCIGIRQLAQEVERLLGRRVFVSASRSELVVEGHVERTAQPAVWHVVLAVSDAEGRALGARELDSREKSCRSLDDALALAVALMIDPNAVLLAGQPPPAPSAPPPQATPEVEPTCVCEPAKPCKPAQPSDPSEEKPWHGSVRAGLLLGWGLVPQVGVGLLSTATLEPPGFIALEGSFGALMEQEEEVAGASGAFSLQYFGVAACPLAYHHDRFDLSTCVEVQVGMLQADGLNFDANWDETRPLCNLAARMRIALHIADPLDVGVGLAGALPLLRDRFVYVDEAGNQQRLYRMSSVAFLPDVSLGLHFD